MPNASAASAVLHDLEESLWRRGTHSKNAWNEPENQRAAARIFYRVKRDEAGPYDCLFD